MKGDEPNFIISCFLASLGVGADFTFQRARLVCGSERDGGRRVHALLSEELMCQLK